MSLADAEKAIPAVVRMFSGCEDKQTSADVSNVGSFKLPDPAGRAGGALTSAMLHVTYDDHHDTGKDLSFKQVLMAIRDKLKAKGFEQIPQLSSSRPTNLDEPFTVIPDNFSGRRRAVMIGINYVGHNPGELRGCHNDVLNMIDYLKTCHGFQEDDFEILMDDGEHTPPTAANIMNAYARLAAESEAGDAVFCHYSGHGCSIPDDNGDEDDGKDEALCPIDYQKTGVLRDDLIFARLVAPMKRGVTVTCVMDCCHSGSILDLPYEFLADGKHEEMELDPEFQFGPLLALGAALVAGAVAVATSEGFQEFRAKNKARRKARRDRWKNRLGM